MVRVGFDALTISRAQPWLDTSDEHENRDPVSDARRVSVEAGLPIVRRTHVDRLETLPYSAFLRQPLVVYGHHWDWPGGAEAVAETAAAVARITDVEWLPMADVARWGSEVTRNGAQIALDVRSRQTLVEVPAGVTTLVVDPESIDPRDRLCVGGVGVDPGVPVEVSAGDSVSVTLSPSDAASIEAIHAALDHGVNWIDTAPIYGSGHSETIVGRAVKALCGTLFHPHADPSRLPVCVVCQELAAAWARG